MSNELLPNETPKEFIDRLTRENLSKPFEEFPKSLYHCDGTSIIVRSRTEQDSRGADYFEKPQEAIDERARRDKVSSDAFIAKVNAEAKAATAADKSKKVA